jgi:hypothetical protein
MSGRHLNHRKFKAVEVRSIADDVSNELKFLDRWHEQALESGVLRAQIVNMIACIVLTLITGRDIKRRQDGFLAGGPRI